MNPVILSRLKHLFFAGLVLIFISLFFTHLHSKGLPGIKVTLTGFQAAFGKSPAINFHAPERGDEDGFDGLGIGGRELLLLFTPRILGIYFLTALLLTVWGMAAWLANGSNGRVHITSIAWGLFACLALAFLAITLDLGRVNDAMPRNFQIRLRDYAGYGPGFWIFLAGLGLCFAGGYMPVKQAVAQPVKAG